MMLTIFMVTVFALHKMLISILPLHKNDGNQFVLTIKVKKFFLIFDGGCWSTFKRYLF